MKFIDEDYEIDGVDYVGIGSFGPNRVGQNLYDGDDILNYYTGDITITYRLYIFTEPAAAPVFGKVGSI